MIRVTQERSFAGMGWGPSLQLLWPEITQGQVHRDKLTIGASTQVIQVQKEKDTHKSTEREGGRQHYGRSQWRCGRCGIIGG